jgi:hypothetical protein
VLPGARIVTTDTISLVLNNAGLTNDGDYIAGKGRVIFTGDMATAGSFIGGQHPIAFYDVVIDKTAHDVQLNGNAAIGGSVVLHSGNLQLNNYMLDLGSTGRIMGESERACITGVEGGTIRVEALLDGSGEANPGNIGIGILADAYMGRTVITRGHVQQVSASGQYGIGRYFDIAPEVAGGISAGLRFYYLDRELAGIGKDRLTIFSTEGSQGNWRSWGNDAADLSGNWVAKNKIGQLSRFTLATSEVKGQSAGSMEVYPNPATTGMFRAVLYSPTEKDIVMGLYDQPGHLLAYRKVHCLAGTNEVTWDVAGRAKGVYYLVAVGWEPIKVVVQ